MKTLRLTFAEWEYELLREEARFIPLTMYAKSIILEHLEAKNGKTQEGKIRNNQAGDRG